MSFDPLRHLDQELAFATLIGSLKTTAALLGAAKSIDVAPGDLSHLIDLITEKVVGVAELFGFEPV